MTAALELTGIRKRYGALVAVDGASLTVSAGTIHALFLRENGAGKPTLVRIAYGLVMPDEGSIRVFGSQLPVHTPAPAMRNGVGRVQQHFALVRALSVVEGSGSLELLYALAGRTRPADGILTLPDEIGFVPDDRQAEALLLEESVSFNVALRGAGQRRGWIRKRGADAQASRVMADGGIRRESVDTPVSSLSGGNQQRLILARELAGNPPLLVVVNPTRGLEVAATRETQRRVRAASRTGMAIIYHSVDLDEVIVISHRVVVVYDGRVREVACDRDANGRAMLGAA